MAGATNVSKGHAAGKPFAVGHINEPHFVSSRGVAGFKMMRPIRNASTSEMN
jgi:hypothetical protein